MAGSPFAVCVLGCSASGPAHALRRRARVGAERWRESGAECVVACGGRAWAGRVEADELARLLEEAGVPAEKIVRERCSLDTFENAKFAAELLRRRGIEHVVVVTCAWHLARATALFRRAGLAVEGAAVEPPKASAARRVYWRVREALSSAKDARREMVRVRSSDPNEFGAGGRA